ncbi:hypothetical protein DM01DRAFT_1380501 [Hesseltinella vesiculosa]|uniref:Uncharacterized protein n=1 Tax=Hesseltinella vesiculosa TaxID=101127 RepID=A0A1X2GUF1_9FUNG|nr:hypothetical protein DM01DRAFT_1380501 [Hesseltinella vesiculosa]
MLFLVAAFLLPAVFIRHFWRITFELERLARSAATSLITPPPAPAFLDAAHASSPSPLPTVGEVSENFATDFAFGLCGVAAIVACYVLLWGALRLDLYGQIRNGAVRFARSFAHWLSGVASGAVHPAHQLVLAVGFLVTKLFGAVLVLVSAVLWACLLLFLDAPCYTFGDEGSRSPEEPIDSTVGLGTDLAPTTAIDIVTTTTTITLQRDVLAKPAEALPIAPYDAWLVETAAPATAAPAAAGPATPVCAKIMPFATPTAASLAAAQLAAAYIAAKEDTAKWAAAQDAAQRAAAQDAAAQRAADRYTAAHRAVAKRKADAPRLLRLRLSRARMAAVFNKQAAQGPATAAAAATKPAATKPAATPAGRVLACRRRRPTASATAAMPAAASWPAAASTIAAASTTTAMPAAASWPAAASATAAMPAAASWPAAASATAASATAAMPASPPSDDEAPSPWRVASGEVLAKRDIKPLRHRRKP